MKDILKKILVYVIVCSLGFWVATEISTYLRKQRFYEIVDKSDLTPEEKVALKHYVYKNW